MLPQDEALNAVLDEVRGLRRDLKRYLQVLHPKKFPPDEKKKSFAGAAVLSVNYRTGKVTSSAVRPMVESK